jgi:hypothetical protein
MRTLAVLALLLGACVSSPATAPSPTRDAATQPPRLACVYDVRQPITAYGELAGYFGPDGADCVPPNHGGDTIAVGLGLRGLLVKARVSRTDGAWSLYATTDDAWCGGDDWEGEVRAVSDLPRWHFEIDARCRTAPIVIVATIFGEAD